ncbi:MAG: hypothetical protein P3W97_007090 [Tepidimonas sp.]|uniref:hypothetical protein n=1 Tax=Tepidimonas sp. TaxID=2002775 RepID=UPI00259F425F|nr:hypothetical protein [Tepidimonas sp.]MDM7457007.1 hypothetical protein [Tepidimonas sp.]
MITLVKRHRQPLLIVVLSLALAGDMARVAVEARRVGMAEVSNIPPAIRARLLVRFATDAEAAPRPLEHARQLVDMHERGKAAEHRDGFAARRAA